MKYTIEFRVKLGRNLKEIRQKARLSISDLSYFFGIHEETLKEFELGNIEVPTLILADYLEIKDTNGELVREYLKQKRRR